MDEAEIVAEAYGKYATGRHTDQSLATWLNQTNFRPRVHRRERKQKQAVWSKDTVGSMLTNSFYLGYVKYKGELLPGQHSAVVSQAVFDSVQAIRKQHRRGPSTFAPRHRTYLLSGLIRSVQCGEKLAAHHISRNDYYQDTCIRRGLPCSDSMRYVRGDSVDAQVSGIISSLKLPYSWRDQVLTMLSSRGEIEEVQNEKARLDEKMRRLKRQYREVEIDEAEYRQELQLTQAKLATLTVPEQEEMVHLGDHVEGMVVAWQQATKEERRDMLRLMLEAVYVDMDTKEVVGLKPKPAFLPLFHLEQPVMANNNVVLTTNLTADGPDSGRGRHCDSESNVFQLLSRPTPARPTPPARLTHPGGPPRRLESAPVPRRLPRTCQSDLCRVAGCVS
ncbi:MAG: recombinase family protein [Chloroflexi bacterium]|nr:recombinase family protein [Chloroflexota bacterium]